MGFFSGLMGGGESKSVSGYGAMPAFAQDTLKAIDKGVNRYVLGGGNIQRFTPMSQTADETAAFDLIRQGFAPTEQSLANDISLQMNPYNQYVIDGINREAGGNYSILKQAQNQAGQFGSNRGMLGANDIDLTRTNQIGSFLQGQYNTAANNAMTVLPALRAADATGLLGIGQFQRGLDLQTKQAPIQALQTAAGISQGMGATVNGSEQTQSTGGGFGDLLGGIGGMAMGASALGGMGFFGGAAGGSMSPLQANLIKRWGGK